RRCVFEKPVLPLLLVVVLVLVVDCAQGSRTRTRMTTRTRRIFRGRTRALERSAAVCGRGGTSRSMLIDPHALRLVEDDPAALRNRRFMESPLSIFRMHWDHELVFRKPLEINKTCCRFMKREQRWIVA